MSYTRKIAYNTIIQYVGKGLTTAISLVLIAALARYLGVYGYGQYTTVFAYVAFWSVLADFGFFWVLVRELSKPDANVEKTTNNILTFRTVLGIIVFSLGFLIALFLKYDITIKLGIGVIGIAWLWTTLNSTLVAVFQSKLRMDLAVLTEVIGRAVILGFVLFAINSGLGLVTIFWAYVIGNIVNLILSMLFAKPYLKLRFAFDFDYWKEIFVLALPIGISMVLHLIYFRVDTVILSLMKGSIDVGIYGAPYKILEVLLLIPSLFMGAAFPVLTRYYVTKDKKLTPAFQKAFDFLTILALPVVVGIFVLSQPIIHFIAGGEFTSASTISILGISATATTALQILIFSVGISFITNLFYYLVVVLGKQKDLIKPYLFIALANIILNIIFIPRFSYVAAAVTTVLSEIMVVAFTYSIVYNNLKLRPNLTVVPKAIIASIIMGVVIYLLPGLNLFLLILIGAIIYIVIVLLTKAVNKDMLLELIRKENNG